MLKTITSYVNLIYRTYLNLYPVRNLDGLKDVQIVGWVSDLTHLREQLPVFALLNETYSVCFLTNKNDIKSYIESNTNFRVGTLKFNKTNDKYLAKLFKRKLPKLTFVYIGNDLRADDALIGSAIHEMKIKYAVITHGINYLNDRLGMSNANQLFVWTDEEKTRMINQGITAERIFVSGSPYLHQLNNGIDSKKINMNEVSLESELKTKVLVAISGPGHFYNKEEHINLINDLNLLAIELTQSYQFINKLHRKDSPLFYQNKLGLHLINENKIPDYISKIVPLINYSDIVISGASTSVLEAMFLDKPVVIFDKNPSVKKLPFLEDGVVKHCINISELKRVLNDLQKKDYKDEYIQKQRNFLGQHFPDMKKKQPAKVITNKLMELNQC